MSINLWTCTVKTVVCWVTAEFVTSMWFPYSGSSTSKIVKLFGLKVYCRSNYELYKLVLQELYADVGSFSLFIPIMN